jgi:anti-sigma factor RsiW
MANDECLKLRRDADESAGVAIFQAHMAGCDACKRWHRENEEMSAMVSSMPQFDVSEALTQKIMNSVEAQPKRHLVSSLWVPLSVVAVAASVTVVPLDTLEGLLSTALGGVGLYAVYLLIKGAPAEEMVG